MTAGDDATPLVASVGLNGSTAGQTDLAGQLTILWDEAWDAESPMLSIDAPGFHGVVAPLEGLPSEVLAVRLDPVVLDGVVTTPDGRPLPDAIVSLGGRAAVTDEEGVFRLVRAQPGEIAVARPAWSDMSIPWDIEAGDVEIVMQPRMIRALRVAGDKAGDPVIWNQLLELADTTAINAFVVDTKEEGGTVMRDVDLSAPYDAGAVRVFYDTDKIISDMDAHGIYKITRIVTFQDNPWATLHPEYAARDASTGDTWKNNKGLRWLDPTDRDSWQYALDLAVESCERGFDEIQFDYIRFPSDGPVGTLEFDEFSFGSKDFYYGAEAQVLRTETIAAFLSEARSRLNPIGCAVAADIFAITLESSTDEGIGQSPAVLANSVDVLSPMIYTYTYGPGWKNFEDPDEHAIEIVSQAIDAGIPKVAEGFSIYRPWIQRAFLEDEEILELQATVEEREMGWMLWSANTQFNARMLPPPE